VFQSHFWVNLHHGLRAEARRAGRGEEPRSAGAGLSAEERATWDRALEVYRPLAAKSLLFDEGLVRMHAALAQVQGDGLLPPGVVDSELAAALDAAAPIFRAHVWPARRRENERWIEGTRPIVERLAGDVTDDLAAAYRLAWPAEPILVDVTADTGPDLAYTTNVAPPGFAGLAAINPSVAGGSAAAIECVFHEASHVVDGALVRAVEEASARVGVAPPRELWHALLFYTSGFCTARALGREGTYRADLTRGFPECLPALDVHWLPYLEGTGPFEAALDGLVRAVASRAAQVP
jgi:hypothetical protein